MNCILAFLLYTGAKVEQNRRFAFHTNQPYESRIVFLSSRYQVSYYRVCRFKEAIAFPSSQDPDIFATRTRLDDYEEVKKNNPASGTYVKEYCSFKYEGYEIARIVSRPLDYWSTSTHNHFGINSHREMECLIKARPAVKFGIARTPISLKTLLDENICDENLIANLAYGCKIVVGGKFKDFAPSKGGEELDIIADVPIHMENVVYEKAIFMEHHTSSFHSGLVWYQGHLHLFRLNTRNDCWVAETDLINEISNGTPIIEHAMKGHQQLKKLNDLREQLFYGNGEGSSSQVPSNSNLGLKNLEKIFRDKVTSTLIEKLQARTVKGIIYGTPEWKKRFEGNILGYIGVTDQL